MNIITNLAKNFASNVREVFAPTGKSIETKEQAVQALKRMDGDWKRMGLLGLAYVASLATLLIFNHNLQNYSLVIAAAGTAATSTLLYAHRRDELRMALASKKIEGLSVENGLVKETPDMTYRVNDFWKELKKDFSVFGFNWNSDRKVDHIELAVQKQSQE